VSHSGTVLQRRAETRMCGAGRQVTGVQGRAWHGCHGFGTTCDPRHHGRLLRSNHIDLLRAEGASNRVSA